MTVPEKTVKGYDVSINNDKYSKDDFTFDGNDIVKATDAGTYDMELAAKDFTNTNRNFSKVTFKIVNGQLKIKKKAVEFTGESASKVYNGATQENHRYHRSWTAERTRLLRTEIFRKG